MRSLTYYLFSEETTMAEFASKGVAGSGLGLGIAGTALGVLNSGVLPGLFGGAAYNGMVCSENTPVNRYEMDMSLKMAEKDARIGLLESQVYVDQKLVDTTTYLMGQINGLAAEVRANKDAQNAINMQQAVYNGTNTAAIGCIQGQVAELLALTKRVVPNSSVCPGWGNATVAPAGAATT